MKIKPVLFAVALLSLSLTGFAQSTNPWSHYMCGGIKRNIFTKGSEEVGSFVLSPRFNDKDIEPDVRNTISFAFGLTSYKPMSKRWTFSSTLGIDMQQLSVETGMKKRFSSATVSLYSREEIHTLYSRLKLNMGFDYAFIKQENTSLSLGLSAGQMVNLSKEGYSYSFIESSLAFSRKRYKLFASGSFTPYNVTIPGSEAFYGNINAEHVSARVAYRIVDIIAGVAIKIK